MNFNFCLTKFCKTSVRICLDAKEHEYQNNFNVVERNKIVGSSSTKIHLVKKRCVDKVVKSITPMNNRFAALDDGTIEDNNKSHMDKWSNLRVLGK